MLDKEPRTTAWVVALAIGPSMSGDNHNENVRVETMLE